MGFYAAEAQLPTGALLGPVQVPEQSLVPGAVFLAAGDVYEVQSVQWRIGTATTPPAIVARVLVRVQGT